MTFTAQGTFVQCTTTNCICVVKAQGPLPHLIMKLSVMQRIREVAERKKKSLKVKENKYKLGKLIFIFFFITAYAAKLAHEEGHITYAKIFRIGH